MLEKPDLQDERIMACLEDEYGLPAVRVSFLPLGADVNTAVYRLTTKDETPFFLKLRKGVFDEMSVVLPKFFSDLGIQQIIPPLATQTGQLWGNLSPFKTILYPYVEGRNAYEVDLLDHHWRELGSALKRIHTAEVTPALTSHINQETYTARARESVRLFLTTIDDGIFTDPITRQLATFLKTKRVEVIDLVDRAEQLAQELRSQPPEWVVCHSDIHAGNIFIGTNGDLYIVDWDEPIMAPKERDLMYIGGGLLASGLRPPEEEALFYRTYGQTVVNSVALAYYRYERIIQDIAVFCEQLLLTNDGGEDREQSLHYLKSNFLPNNTIEIALRSDKTKTEFDH